MKRFLKQMIIGICLVSFWSLSVQAAGYTEFHVENTDGKAGDTVTVPVRFNSGQEVGGFQISIYYDTEIMELQNLEKGDLIIENEEGIFDYNNIEESGEIVVVYVVANTVKDEGVIINLEFKLKKDCGKQLPIGMEVDQLVDNSEESQAIEGQVLGVDEEFQAKITKKNSHTEIVAEQQAGNEIEAKTKVEQEALDREEKKEKDNSETAAQDIRKDDIYMILGIGVIAVIVIACGTVLYKRRKYRNK